MTGRCANRKRTDMSSRAKGTASDQGTAPATQDKLINIAGRQTGPSREEILEKRWPEMC